jgi:hypothetical protein
MLSLGCMPAISVSARARLRCWQAARYAHMTPVLRCDRSKAGTHVWGGPLRSLPTCMSALYPSAARTSAGLALHKHLSCMQ